MKIKAVIIHLCFYEYQYINKWVINNVSKIGKAGIWDLGPHISTSHNHLSKVFIFRTKQRGKAANYGFGLKMSSGLLW